MVKIALAVGAPPRTPLGQLTELHRLPSWTKRKGGEGQGKKGKRRGGMDMGRIKEVKWKGKGGRERGREVKRRGVAPSFSCSIRQWAEQSKQ